jgi:hypothetical protein
MLELARICNMKMLFVVSLGLVVNGALAAAPVNRLADDFGSGLGQWVGRAGGGHSGVTVLDPLNSGRGQVLSFTDFASGGDLFTSARIKCDDLFTLSFDYLGLARPGSVPGDLGGFLGISTSLNPMNEGQDIFWLAGTIDSYPGLLIPLLDDGLWHRYELDLDGRTLGAFRITMEDYGGSGGNCGDIYFDNLLVQCKNTPVPEPSAAVLLLVGLAGAAWRRKQD